MTIIGYRLFISLKEKLNICSKIPEPRTDLSTHTNVGNNTVQNPGISATNPVPSNTLVTGSTPTNTWFTSVNYIGAFDGTNWASGWTMLFN